MISSSRLSGSADVGVRAQEVVEVCGMGDLEHLDEDAGYQIGGLVSVGQQPGEE